MVIRALLLLLTAIVILLGSHGLFYVTIRRCFSLPEGRVRTLFLAAFIALALSFPLSMALNAALSNFMTRILYFLSAFWIGTAIYLLGAVALTWVVAGVLHLTGRSVDLRIVFCVLAAGALAVSIIGLWRAKHPEVRTVEVKMENLPPAWEGRCVVHLSDLHLGPIHRSGFVEDVAETVSQLDPEAVFITGDLFDGACRDPAPLKDALSRLKARRGVYFVTGNHEGYLGFERAVAVVRDAGIRILEDELVDLDGLQVVGLGYPEYRRDGPGRDPFSREGGYDPDRPNILLYHTPTNVDVQHAGLSSQQVQTYFSPSTDFRFAREKGVDLQLSGHTHGGQIWPFQLLTDAIYQGYDRGLHEKNGFSIYISEGTGTWGPPLRTTGCSEITVIRLTGK